MIETFRGPVGWSSTETDSESADDQTTIERSDTTYE